MIIFSVIPNQTLFSKVFQFTWKNTITNRKEDSGFFCDQNFEQGISKFKFIIKQQIAVSITSIANERKNAYTYSWNPTTTKQEAMKYEYLKLCEKLDLFARNSLKEQFDELIRKTHDLSNTTLITITPHITSKKHESIKNKVDQIRNFTHSILFDIEQIITKETAKI